MLRGYRAEDLPAMFAMDVVCFGEPFRFDARSMRRFAEARKAIVLVAERVGRERPGLVGFVIVHVERGLAGQYGYVVTLDVAPEERRVGVAGRLMDAVEGRAAEAGARAMALHVYTENGSAVRFYEGRGYRRERLEAGFYGEADGVRLDAYVYRKELSATDEG